LFFTPRGFTQVVVSSTSGQVTQSGSAYIYTQSFDSLGTMSGSWTDNVTLPGWHADKQLGSTTVTSYTADNGSSTVGGLHSYGSIGATDRALGSLWSNTTGNLAYGAIFQNQTGSAVTVNVAYTGEHWHNGGNQAQTLNFTYKVSPTNITDFAASAETAGGFTPFNALDFTTPTHAPGQFALDGNAPANRTALSALLPVTLNPGDYLALRWFDTNNQGKEHGMAVDDLSATFTPVPETGPALAAAAVGLGMFTLARRARRRVAA
jgi:hypothetical protein